jgi:glycosyltransferase involved in cell wall biosynthesis
MTRKRILMIVGMQRSGASLAAQALDKLGISFGRKLSASTEAGARNSLKDYEITGCTEAVLEILGRQPFRVGSARPLPEGWWKARWLQEYTGQLCSILSSRFDKVPDGNIPLGINDPNSTLLLPLWQSVFDQMDISMDCILAIRNPSDIAHLAFQHDDLDVVTAERIWLNYNLSAIHLAGDQIKQVIDYSDWGQNPGKIIEKLASALNLENEPQPDTEFVNIDNFSFGKKACLQICDYLYQSLRDGDPGSEAWAYLCREAETLNIAARSFYIDNPETYINSFASSDSFPEQRYFLESRRMELFYPDLSYKLDSLWPPKFPDSESRPPKTSRVAIIGELPPDPDSFRPVARWSSELLHTLIEAGASATFIYIGDEKRENEARHHCPDNCTFRMLPEPEVSLPRGPLAVANSRLYKLYEYLKNQDYHAIHAPDTGGSTYFCQAARKMSLAFSNTVFVIHPVSQLVVRLRDNYEGATMKNAASIYAERRVLEQADIIPVRGKKTLEVLLQNDINIKPAQVKRFYSLHDAGLARKILPDPGTQPYTTIACLVGNSLRSATLFTGAIRRSLSQEHAGIELHFLIMTRQNDQAREYIDQLTEELPNNVTVTSIHNRRALSRFLKKNPGTVFVCPISGPETTPAVNDIQSAGWPVVLAGRDQVHAHLDPDWPDHGICDQLPDDIGYHLLNILGGERPKTRPPNATPRLEHGLIAPLCHALSDTKEENTEQEPLVTVCILHFERPDLVRQAIESVRLQTYKNIEIVLVDDSSKTQYTLDGLEAIKNELESAGDKIIRHDSNRYLGAARNTAALAADGKYIYFLDDDNYLKSHAIETLVRIAEVTKLDILTTFSEAFEGSSPPDKSIPADRRIIQVGDDLTYGLFRNAFGDSNALIRRNVFCSLGGNSEDWGVGKDDQEFYARAILEGQKLAVVPEALFWARQMPTRLRNLHFSSDAGFIRVARTYAHHLPAGLRAVLLIAVKQFSWSEHYSPNRPWRIKLIIWLSKNISGIGWIRAKLPYGLKNTLKQIMRM